MFRDPLVLFRVQIDTGGTVSILSPPPAGGVPSLPNFEKASVCSITYNKPFSVCANFHDGEEFIYVGDISGLWKVSLGGDAVKIGVSDKNASSGSLDHGQVNVSEVTFGFLQQMCPLRTCTTRHKQRSLVFVTEHFRRAGTVRMISGEQTITTVASSTWRGFDDQCKGVLFKVSGVALDDYGCLYVSSTEKNYIAAINAGRVGGLLAGGSDTSGMTDGIAREATFRRPFRLLFDPASQCLYVSQQHCIRKIMLSMTYQIPQQLQLDKMGRITDDGVGADVVFKVGSQLVHAIKALLCENSEYFECMFASSMIESRAKKDKTPINVEGTSYTALKVVVTWVMFDVTLMHADTPTETVIESLRLADRYLVNSLKDRCAALLMRRVDGSTTFSFLKLAQETRVTFLESECVLFLVKHLTEMRRRPEFNELSHHVMMLIPRLVNAQYEP